MSAPQRPYPTILGPPFRTRVMARRAERTVQAALDAGAVHVPIRGQWVDLPPAMIFGGRRGVKVERMATPGVRAKQFALVMTNARGH